ncbi:rhoptry-associated protein 1 like protein [Babesia gibsoni]|uniref:Rhoptry-associated protein 1 like protein n=1 Tax=Babesia gibsoni TaxID=33632 RepID=A0AAD8LRS1_BABGI|nr:rhoptry-associated protein 1 like protein [Babesia gibsoni]
MRLLTLLLILPLSYCLYLKGDKNNNPFADPTDAKGSSGTGSKRKKKEKRKTAETWYDGIEKVAGITKRMSVIAKEQPNVIKDVCKRFFDRAACELDVKAYLDRCKKSVCLKFDEELRPENSDNPVIRLPNPYQLHAAFYLFKALVSNYTLSDGQKIELPKEEFDDFYRIFLESIIRYNLSFKDVKSAQDRFLCRYLYMATMYYKAYRTRERFKARAQNTTKVGRFLFSNRIKEVLKAIFHATVNKYALDIPMDFLGEVMDDYHDYMAVQDRSHRTLSLKYADMVSNTLTSELGLLIMKREQPFYRKAMGAARRAMGYLNPFRYLCIKTGIMSFFSQAGSYDKFMNAAKRLK